ncbi:toxin TcdB middle/N-terminal domain-containing protein [Rhizobium sp.]|uniref:toxin TcdB middle/N-terminal domain-containing protein n=1 Tax=Rhizobium sp. TaxID=391 RepID=UPI00289D18BB
MSDDNLSSSNSSSTDNRDVDLTTVAGQADVKTSKPREAKALGSGTALGKSNERGGDAETNDENAGKDEAVAKPEAKAALAAAAATTDGDGDSHTANAPDKPSIPEIAGNGFFTQKIGIDVPAFRGLEPKLSLSYNSGRKTRLGGLYQGWAGYAWGMDGLDVIERATPGYGVPAYDTGDVYLLNGEELVACTTGMVAGSCLAGGTHVAEVENFKRVVFDSAANTWTVTDRDGTRSVFKSVMALTGSTPAADSTDYKLQHDGRYLLAQVIDTNNNTVSYAYTCPQSPVCYPSKVTYGGGASIDFYYEVRPDWQIMANGISLSTTRYRLITIGVSAGGSLRSAYKLTYDQAPISNVSRLTKVEQYGRGSTITSGVVTGANVRTIRQMTYDNATMTYASKANTLTETGAPASSEVSDLNFDGRDELYGQYAPKDCANDCRLVNNLRVVSFTEEGTVASTSSVIVRGNENLPVQALRIGRFVVGRSFRDIAFTYTYTREVGQEIEQTTELKVAKVQSNLSIKVSACGTDYASACNKLPDLKYAALDHDGDGYDTVFDLKKDVLNIADLFGNGRQGAFLAADPVRVRSYTNGAWKEVNGPVICEGPSARTSVPRHCTFGDINGDGLSDILAFTDGGTSARVFLSTGQGFVLSTASATMKMLYGAFPTLRDLDNDGRMEVVTSDGTLRVWSVTFDSNGGTLVRDPSFSMKGGLLSGDFNGDGLPDFFRSGTAMWISQAGSGNPNLLRSVTLQTGGVVSVDYTPSTRWMNTFMPQVLHAVTQMRVSDGRGTVATTDYAYTGGLYDPAARKFLGYKTITVTKPAANGEASRPVVTTTYRQDLASYGLPETTVSRNGESTATKTVVDSYSVNATTKPYRAFNTVTETTLNEGGASLVLRKERAFDNYGNVTQIRDLGRTDVSGDETRTSFLFNPNLSAYIVSLPTTKEVRNAATDTVLSYEGFYYDGFGCCSAPPPVKGNLTIWDPVHKYGGVDGVWASRPVVYGYDGVGNRISQTDADGSRTEWDYDPQYQLLVVAERAPKFFATGGQPADTRFVTTYANNNVCGKPSKKTDWNGIAETYAYDPFCRPFEYAHSGTGKYVHTRYENEGNPGTQAVVSYEASTSNGLVDLFTRIFYDGLGRSWRVQTPGDAIESPTRLSDTLYDARGNIKQTTFARFDNEPAYWTINSYDWQDRLTRTLNPDGTQKTYRYQLATDTALWGSYDVAYLGTWKQDELGQLSYHITSTTGHEIASVRVPNGSWLIEQARTYDALGRLLLVFDGEGAHWKYTYDLVGNRLTASDPDLGDWSYVYDNANRLVRQVDARGAVTILNYDQMGRLLTKQVQAAGEPTPTTVTSNTYDQIDQPPAFAYQTHQVGVLTTSVGNGVTRRFGRHFAGWGTVLGQAIEIDGLSYSEIKAQGRQDKPGWQSYLNNAVPVGMSSPYWYYNAADLLYSIPDYILSTSYEADGQTRQITYANGVTTTFNYSPQRRWLTRVTTQKGATVLMDNHYTRNAIGQITAITGLTPAESWTYTYSNDGCNRLASADNLGDNSLDETYSYSLNGNLTYRTRMGNYVYPAAGALRPHAASQIGAKSISYDANGNMLSDGSRSLTWNGANQLSSVTENGQAVNFTYGPDGSRVKKAWAFGTTLYAGADVEIDNTIPGSPSYTLYPHPDIKITATAAGPTAKFFLHRDHLSSVRIVTDGAGTETEKTAYVSYGEPTNKAMVTKKGYIGERFDAETGLMYLNARYYDPAFGRFIPQDDEAAGSPKPEASQVATTPQAEAQAQQDAVQ